MKLTALFIHPIKACRGISVDEARVTDRGLEHDRRFMLVDENGTFFTQRTEPRLSSIATAIAGTSLVVSAPGFGAVRLPLALTEGESRDVVVWRSRLVARVSREGSAFVSAFCDRPLSLVYMPDDVVRGVNPAYGRPTDRTSFADGYPFLLLSEKSLADLSERVGAQMVVERFRPNLVIDGDEPHVEDRMISFTIGDVRFRGVKPCERCVVTTIDPVRGVAGREPLRTLAKYRRGPDGGVLFGMNLVHDGPGSVRVGDEVRTLRTADRP